MTAGPTPDFETVHEAWRDRVVRYLARFVGEHEAGDVAQEVFVRVARGLPAFRGDARLSTWIHRIARNAAVDRLRRGTPARAPEPAGTADEDDDDAARETVRGGAGPDSGPADPVSEGLERREMNACIRGLVAGLPPNDRAVLALGEMRELTDREVADALGVSVGTAKIRRHRARARLRKELERRCDFYRDGSDRLACDRKCPS